MAAQESVQAETRVVLDDGPRRFVTMCYELFHEAGPDFAVAARTYARQMTSRGRDVSVEPATAPDARLKVLRLVPRKLDMSSEAVFIEGLLVRNTDGTVQELDFYVNPQGAKAPTPYRALRSRVSASLQPGDRRLDRRPREVMIEQGTTRPLSLRLPKDCILTVDEGPDFTVYRVRRITPLAVASGTLGIYVGGAPDTRWPKAEAVRGTLLGEAVEWQRYTKQDPKAAATYRQDVLVPRPGLDGLYLHVFVVGMSPRERAELQMVAESLRLSPTASAPAERGAPGKP